MGSDEGPLVMFVVGKVWLFAAISGLIFLFPKQSRFLATHLLLGSTLGLVLAFVFMGIARALLGAETSIAVPAMAAGGVSGLLVAMYLSRRLNVAVGWKPPRASVEEQTRR